MSSSPDKPSGPPPLTEPQPAEGPPPLPPDDSSEPPPPSDFLATNRARVLLGAITGVFALLGIVMALFAGIMLVRMTLPRQQIAGDTGEQSTAAEDAPDDQGTPGTSSRPGRRQSPPEASRKKGPPPEIETAETEVTSDDPDSGPDELSEGGETAEPDPPPPKERPPFEDIKKRNRVLPLPELRQGIGGPSGPKELAKLYVGSPDDCQLSIVGSEHVLQRGRSFETSRNDTDGTPTWTVVSEVKNVPATQGIGSFTLKGDSLMFQWDAKGKSATQSGKLQYCLLDIRVREESERCILTKPKEVDSVKADVLGSPQVELPLDPDWLSKLDLLRLDLRLEGFPRHELKKAAGVKAGDNALIRILSPEGDESFIEIKVSYFAKQQECLLLEAFVMVPPPTGPQLQEATGDWLRKGSLEWNTERVKKLDADLDETRKSIRDHQRELDELSGRVAQLKLDRARARGLNPAKEAQLAIEISQIDERLRPAIQQALQKLKAEESSAQQSRDAAEQLRQSFETLNEVFAKLKAEGIIDYRVYAEIEGEKVGLIQSKGYSPVRSS